MNIIADKREKNSLVISELVEKGVDVDFNHLDVGDFVISSEIAVERKTINDFISSMMNRRLLKQLSDLRANYPKPLLIIEGVEEQDLYGNGRFNIHENSVRGMILSTMLDFGIPIIFAKDYKDTANFLSLLVKRQERPAREISLKAKRKAFSLSEQQQFIIESFPGIGPKLAKELLKQFKSVKGVVNAKKERMQKIRRLDKNKIEKIKKILETEYPHKQGPSL